MSPKSTERGQNLPYRYITNDMYAKDISKKVRSALRAKMNRGEFIGAFAPYGYQKHPDNNDILVIDEYAAGIVKRIFDLYVKGMPMMAIAQTLNNECIPCPANYKKLNGARCKVNKDAAVLRWSYSAINRILSNEVYIGNMVQKKSEIISYKLAKKRSTAKNSRIVVYGTHASVIDMETFNLAQKRIASRTRMQKLDGCRTDNRISVFAGLLKCGDCGHALTKCVSKIYKEKTRSYYKCSAYRLYGREVCSLHTIREDILSSIVLRAIRAEAVRLLTNENLKSLKDLLQNLRENGIEKPHENQLKKKREKLDSRLEGLYEDYADKLITRDEYIRYKSKYEAERSAIQNSLSELENFRTENTQNLCHIEQWLDKFIEYAEVDTLTRELMVELIECIKIYENKKIEIEFKFKSE